MPIQVQRSNCDGQPEEVWEGNDELRNHELMVQKGGNGDETTHAAVTYAT